MSIVEDSPILSPTFGRRMTSTYAVTTSVLIFAAASAPTPLYRLYEASWGLSAFTVTVTFAAYPARTPKWRRSATSFLDISAASRVR
jgi:hypothetical protein